MKQWKISKTDVIKQKQLTDSFKISPLIAQLLINRGIHTHSEAEKFLNSSHSKLNDPFLMKDMDRAVERIIHAINNKEKVLIHGDYDVDGVTAVCTLYSILKENGLTPHYYIPHRQIEGYGLGESGVREAVKIKADLVITVDCGITADKEAGLLKKHNIDFIITDHHEVPEILPTAYAIVTPLQKDCPYPDKGLAGVGIAFKLCQALCSKTKKGNPWKYVDLVLLGTVSDVVPLVGENRILVKEGLRLLNTGQINKGLKALIEANSLTGKKISPHEISFILGPRINAAGRMGSAYTAIDLFLAEDSQKALELAVKLNEANKERQKIEGAILKEAVSKIDTEINFKTDKVIVLYKEGWHIGVMGIVASKISDMFYRPAILISTKDGIGKGSGRSVENFHLHKALAECEEILNGYGGHEYACGLSIMEEHLERFKEVINRVAHNSIAPEQLTPSINIDMEIELSHLDYKTVEDIGNIEPFGEGNPEPVFCSKNLRLLQPYRLLKGEHVKLYLSDGSKNFEAIGFRLGKDNELLKILDSGKKIDLAYSVSFNTWQGLESIQLRIEDIKPSD